MMNKILNSWSEKGSDKKRDYINQTIRNSSKMGVSLKYFGSTVGELLPPYLVYKPNHMWNTWAENGPTGARYNNTTSRWFDALAFADWFQSMFPRLKKLEGKNMLTGDNLSSHLTQIFNLG
jgi:hypothetical protein